MSNALTDALKFKKAIGAPTKGLYPPKTQHNEATSQSQMLHFHKDQVNNLGNAKQGDKISVRVHGVFHAADPNGNMTMHVHDVKPDTQDMEKTQYPEQKTRDRGFDKAN